MFVSVPQLLKAAVVINFRLLTEDPNMRLGARGASEVMFFSQLTLLLSLVTSVHLRSRE